jgi:hypothetical protein
MQKAGGSLRRLVSMTGLAMHDLDLLRRHASFVTQYG